MLHQAPLYTAEERVVKAFLKVTDGKSFTAEQNKWLEKIRKHLISNLAIAMEDFELMPVFVESGGWGRANHIFGHRLNEILIDLNEAIAA
jgi:type I restriction enzyme, R subunit